jgi:5-methylcytosine-specific restriction endonuclease McrA
MKRRRKPLPAELKRNAEELWNMVSLPETGGAYAYCAGGCGQMVPHGSEVHHIVAAGLGGERDHAIENLEYRCRDCHNKAHGRK